MTELTIGQSAYVYHPDTVSSFTHPLAVQDVTTTDVTTDDTDLTVEKRLNVSKDLLRPIGLTAGKIVKVSTTNGVMSIEATTLTAGETLIVNSDGRLRLGEKVLTRAFGKIHTKYDISLSSDNSVIKIQPKLT